MSDLKFDIPRYAQYFYSGQYYINWYDFDRKGVYRYQGLTIGHSSGTLIPNQQNLTQNFQSLSNNGQISAYEYNGQSYILNNQFQSIAQFAGVRPYVIQGTGLIQTFCFYQKKNDPSIYMRRQSDIYSSEDILIKEEKPIEYISQAVKIGQTYELNIVYWDKTVQTIQFV